MIREGAFFDNAGYGVKLETATQNTVTVNALYGNAAGAVDSPAAELKPEILSALPNNQSATSFAVSGRVPTAVQHVELFRSSLNGGNTNYINNVVPDPSLNFNMTIEATQGEDVFAVAIGSDGSTGPSSTPTKLGSTGGSGTNGGGERPCFPGVPVPNHVDYDGDGIKDYLEDKDFDCVVGPDETDPGNKDTDGDEIPDGKEDRNHNGIFEPELNESDPKTAFTDGDGLYKVSELLPGEYSVTDTGRSSCRPTLAVGVATRLGRAGFTVAAGQLEASKPGVSKPNG